MNNPWISLPQSEPFVLEDDYQRILRFNGQADYDHMIHLELLPEPFLGNHKAAVVLLNLNPGYKDEDIKFHKYDEYFIKSCRNNLLHIEQEYPFYPLDPRNSGSPAYRWWHRRLRKLIEICGLKKVANGVFCVELFPYHSRRYKRLDSVLVSQQYSFHLVREAVKRNVLIILMRSQRRWLEQVPELIDHKFYVVNSVQNPTISKKNLPDGFSEIIKLLG